jgi:hypothetical protein
MVLFPTTGHLAYLERWLGDKLYDDHHVMRSQIIPELLLVS